MKAYHVEYANELDRQLCKKFEQEQESTNEVDSDDDPDGQKAKAKKQQQAKKMRQQMKKKAMQADDAAMQKPGDPYQMSTEYNYKRPLPNFCLLAYPIITFFSCAYLQNYYFGKFVVSQWSSQFYGWMSDVLIVLCLWSFYITQSTSISPQRVKQIPERLRNINCDDHRVNPASKYCTKCQYYKIPRASHCSNCRQCVLRLDHHCVWIQKCVGYQTHLPFLQFVFYQTIGYFVYWYHNYLVITALYQNCNFFGEFPLAIYILWAITNLTMGLIGSMIVVLFFTQMIGISRNYTTLDGIKNKNCLFLPIYQFRKIFFTDDNIHPYDRGQIQNIKEFFQTSNIFGFIFPRKIQVDDEFFVDKITPYPSRINIEKFSGQYGKQFFMFQQMKKTVAQAPNLYKGKNFSIRGRIITL